MDLCEVDYQECRVVRSTECTSTDTNTSGSGQHGGWIVFYLAVRAFSIHHDALEVSRCGHFCMQICPFDAADVQGIVYLQTIS